MNWHCQSSGQNLSFSRLLRSFLSSRLSNASMAEGLKLGLSFLAGFLRLRAVGATGDLGVDAVGSGLTGWTLWDIFRRARSPGTVDD